MCIEPVCLDDHRTSLVDDTKTRSSAALQRNTITTCSPLSRVLCKQQRRNPPWVASKPSTVLRFSLKFDSTRAIHSSIENTRQVKHRCFLLKYNLFDSEGIASRRISKHHLALPLLHRISFDTYNQCPINRQIYSYSSFSNFSSLNEAHICSSVPTTGVQFRSSRFYTIKQESFPLQLINRSTRR